MTDPKQEYQSLDELFRKTFDNLPESPAPSGWDVPSERVWSHVQTNIQAPKTGWTLQAIGLLSAFAVMLAVGLYLYTARQAEVQTVPLPPVVPVEVPTRIEPTVTDPAAVQPEPEPMAKPSVKPQSSKPKPTQSPATNSAQENAADAKPSLPKAAPLPGTKPVSPNSTERQRSEGGKKDEQN